MTVAVEGLDEPAAHAAADAAFAAVARVHALMSYHEPGSELSRINRDASREAVVVDPLTFEVLARAAELNAASDGAFDPTIAPRLETAGVLPVAEGPLPAPNASWRDVALDAERGTVGFARPLRIDLGGIAKGFAVDQAVQALRQAGSSGGLVNAGGDLRTFGPGTRVALRTGDAQVDGAAVLELADAACASSGSLAEAAPDEPLMALHYAGAAGPVVHGRFVCVTAPDCVLADGLTKVVMARGEAAAPLLAGFGAEAHEIGPDRVWRSYGAQPCDA